MPENNQIKELFSPDYNRHWPGVRHADKSVIFDKIHRNTSYKIHRSFFRLALRDAMTRALCVRATFQNSESSSYLRHKPFAGEIADYFPKASNHPVPKYNDCLN